MEWPPEWPQAWPLASVLVNESRCVCGAPLRRGAGVVVVAVGHGRPSPSTDPVGADALIAALD